MAHISNNFEIVSRLEKDEIKSHLKLFKNPKGCIWSDLWGVNIRFEEMASENIVG